ncbi:MAG TPA: bifunctional phosphoribosylaminoimidazolecarboxamide formyltransferase/IMP cyclohydrolase [candidate division Zixibacteria bacterium]|nr:bifunctional phosphoribosylaminoimidazolecarboxamide formyltransferase/IMP cyclohydrolase [candidate division Zixibacteria bacterium]
MKIKRALISVSDKTGLTEFASALSEFGVEIISTGGTLAALKKEGIQAISVSTFTGVPEILGGRVKTLHPKVHAGILYRRDNKEDEDELSQKEYKRIDLVVVNLYPFEKTVANPDSSDAEIIENIDIGGPTMLRAAAKNYSGVAVVTDPDDYNSVIEDMDKNKGTLDIDFRRKLATKAFNMTNRYERAISAYFNSGKAFDSKGELPDKIDCSYTLKSSMRYGENPHQQASFYIDGGFKGATLARAEQLSGKELSYNNISDLDACLDMLLDFDEPFACVLKHANPCGAAVGATVADAYRDALASDPLSAFGSIIGLNKQVDMAAAELLHKTFFVECILAPGFDDDALALLKKKKNRRLLVLPEITDGRPEGETVSKFVRGGMLLQTADDLVTDESDLKVITERKPTSEEIKSLLFAWKVVKHTKSNAIVLVKDMATVGIGMGQTSRVDASELAVKRAGERAKGAVLASDAFFPMPDGAEVALDAGVTAIIQPGGSKGDEKVIEAVNKKKAAMVFTGIRHFKH